jgi:disulfide bond formation protein DsbB
MFVVGLGIAYYAEYALGKEPCVLCIYTRYFFMVGIVSSGLAYFMHQFGYLTLIITLATMGLSFYHVGVEQHWWLGPDACKSKVVDTKNLSLQDAMAKLKVSLSKKQPVRCDQINWAILGVSATILNTLYLMVIFVIGVSGLCRNRKKI